MNLNIQISKKDPAKTNKKEKKETTTFKRLIYKSLNKREQGSFGSIPATNLRYTVRQMWENPNFKILQKIGIEWYLDKVILRGSSLSPESIVIITRTLKNPIGVSERIRLKVKFFN